MKDAEVLMPINCPECGEEWLEGFSVALVADALISGTRLRMRSRCHANEWDANLVEMEQIREYLRAGCIGPRNASARYAVGVSASVATEQAPRRPVGSLRRPERPTYTRLARENARATAAPAAKSLSTFRLLWFFESVLLRRGR
jgi:hypothetical protein